MKVIAPYDAHIPALKEIADEDDPGNPEAGNVVEGEAYDVPDDIGKSLVAQGWKQSGASSSKPRVAKGNPTP